MELERWYDPRDLGKVKITNECTASHLEEYIKRDRAFLGEKEFAMEALMIMIERFKGLDNQILKMKYMDGMTLREIAEELNYSYSYIMAFQSTHSCRVRHYQVSDWTTWISISIHALV